MEMKQIEQKNAYDVNGWEAHAWLKPIVNPVFGTFFNIRISENKPVDKYLLTAIRSIRRIPTLVQIFVRICQIF